MASHTNHWFACRRAMRLIRTEPAYGSQLSLLNLVQMVYPVPMTNNYGDKGPAPIYAMPGPTFNIENRETELSYETKDLINKVISNPSSMNNEELKKTMKQMLDTKREIDWVQRNITVKGNELNTLKGYARHALATGDQSLPAPPAPPGMPPRAPIGTVFQIPEDSNQLFTIFPSDSPITPPDHIDSKLWEQETMHEGGYGMELIKTVEHNGITFLLKKKRNVGVAQRGTEIHEDANIMMVHFGLMLPYKYMDEKKTKLITLYAEPPSTPDEKARMAVEYAMRLNKANEVLKPYGVKLYDGDFHGKQFTRYKGEVVRVDIHDMLLLSIIGEDKYTNSDESKGSKQLFEELKRAYTRVFEKTTLDNHIQTLNND